LVWIALMLARAEFMDELGPGQSGEFRPLSLGDHASVAPEHGKSQPGVACDILIRCTSRVRQIVRDLDRDGFHQVPPDFTITRVSLPMRPRDPPSLFVADESLGLRKSDRI
jgi:hypothetical protein